MRIPPFPRRRQSPRLDEIADEIGTTWARAERDIEATRLLLEEAQAECWRDHQSFNTWCRRNRGKIGIGKRQIQNILAGWTSSHRAHPVHKASEFLLTPHDRLDELKRVFGINFDACPHPRREGYDSLTEEWGTRTYCNPMFNHDVSRFVTKAISEYRNGKLVVIVLPLCAMGAIARLLWAGAFVYDLDIPSWRSILDGFSTNPTPAKSRQPCLWLVLDPAPARCCPTCGHRIYQHP
jgi:hypothetical protein